MDNGGMKKLGLLMIMALIVASLFARGVKEIIDYPSTETGGKVDKSYRASTEFKSTTIVGLRATFYHYGDGYDYWESSYRFLIDNFDGKNVDIEESRCFKAKITVDRSVLDGVQKILEKWDLLKMNGTDEHTSGLPEEYQPYYFRVVYDSGEELYFSENNDPRSPWTWELVTYMRDVFARNGHPEVVAPPSPVEDFSFHFGDGKMSYWFAPMTVFDEHENPYEALLVSVHGSEEGKDDGVFYCKLDEGIYQKVADLIIEYDLRKLNTGRLAPSDFQPGPNGFFEMYVDYENYSQVYCYGNEVPEEVSKALAELAQYVRSLEILYAE